MAQITKLAQVLNGLIANVDLTANDLVTSSIYVGGLSGTQLTNAIALRLLNVQNGTNLDSSYHLHDTLYTRTTDLASATPGTSGSMLIGDDNSYTNFTPLSTTVKAALQSIDLALSSVVGGGISALTGDVTAMGPGSAAATVVSVGGAAAADIASTVTEVAAATALDTPSTLMARDASGNTAVSELDASHIVMSGTIDMGSQLINNVADPVSLQDAVTLNYLETNYDSMTELASSTAPNAGSTLIGDDNSYTNFTPATTTVKAALQAIDTALAGVGGSTANQSLSNLTNPTALNQDLLPGATAARSVGSTALSFLNMDSSAYTLNDGAGTDVGSLSVVSDILSLLGLTDVSGNSMGITFQTSSPSIANSPSGSIQLTTGAPTGTGQKGNVQISAANLDMGTSPIQNMADPTNLQDAATKNYVDTQDTATSTAILADLASETSPTAGSTLIGDDDDYTNFTPSAPTVKGALEGIDTALAGVSGSAMTSLTGDVTATGPGAAAATVVQVGGQLAADVATAAIAVAAATDAATPSTLVERDASGNFSANIITATITGDASLDLPLDGSRSMTGALALAQLATAPVSPFNGQAYYDTTLGYARVYEGGAWISLLYNNNTTPVAIVGQIVQLGFGAVPSGVLECDGSAVSRTTYQQLFMAIGTSYGIGDGTTTFNLPDFRGYFIRGWDHGAGHDPDAASRTGVNGGSTGDNVGSFQADQFGSHGHGSTLFGTGAPGTHYVGGSGGVVGSTSTDAAGGNQTNPMNLSAMFGIIYDSQLALPIATGITGITGDVTSTQTAGVATTTVLTVGGKSASDIANTVDLVANPATTPDPGVLVAYDGSGNLGGHATADLALDGSTTMTGKLALAQLSTAPASPQAGWCYYDTTLGYARIYEGGAWISLLYNNNTTPVAIVGQILQVGFGAVPAGTLECDGSAVSRTTYSLLFAAIGTAYGIGDGSTTFNLPDFRGLFIRGWNHGSSNDPDAASRTEIPGLTTYTFTGTTDGTTGIITGISDADYANISIGQQIQSDTGSSGLAGAFVIAKTTVGGNNVTVGAVSTAAVSGDVFTMSSGALGDNVGSYQGDQIISHAHGLPYANGIGGGGFAAADSRGSTNGTGSSYAAGGNQTNPRNTSAMNVVVYDSQLALPVSTGISGLAGDVTSPATAGVAVTTVAFVGGVAASDVAAATTTVDAATDAATPSTLVLRDASGNASFANLNATSASITGALNMNNQAINNVLDPVSPQDAATKNYVDSLAQGIAWKNPVRAISTTPLDANTYDNGTAGVGATLTCASNEAFPAIDGVTLALNDRILVAGEAAPANNGIYFLSQVGDGSTPWILTRSLDEDTPTSLVAAAVFVDEGTDNQGSAWVQTTIAPIVIGTSSLLFSQFSSVTPMIYRNGLTQTGQNVDVVPGDASLIATPGSLVVQKSATGAIVLAVDGLAVQVDNSTIAINGSNQLAVVGAGTNVQNLPIGDTFTANTSYAVILGINAQSQTAGQIYQAQASNAASALTFWSIGIAAIGATTTVGTVVPVTGQGIYTLLSGDTNFNTSDIGLACYVNDGGDFTTTSPSASGTAVYKLGIVLSTTQVLIDGKQLLGIN